jgi:NTP pyrophosphatase (non-canonical NTP hydrolase)
MTLAKVTEKLDRVSAVYAERYGIRRDSDWHALKLQEELGEMIAEYLRVTSRSRPRAETDSNALADEAADVLGHLLLFASTNGIDIEAALERKWFRYLGPST